MIDLAMASPAELKFKPSERFAFLLEHLDLDASGDPNAQSEDHQMEFLYRSDTLTHDTKARQIAWPSAAATK